jgi:uncharacterized SAM-binding protein YcdF (DUF218 family)
VLIIGIRLLGDKLYDFPVNPGPTEIPAHSAIVVLAGGKFRIEAALSLFAAGIGDDLFIIGAGKKATPYSLIRVNSPELFGQIPDDRYARIQVENESRDTIENAFAVRKLLQQRPGLKNIILITSSYHMRRAQFILETQLPPGIKVTPFTSPAESIDRTNWWHTWLGVQLTVREYLKFLMASFVLPKIGDVEVTGP